MLMFYLQSSIHEQLLYMSAVYFGGQMIWIYTVLNESKKKKMKATENKVSARTVYTVKYREMI